SNDFHEIKSFVQKIGTNPLVRDKSARFEIPVPSQFVAERRQLLPTPAPTARDFFHLSDSEVSFCGEGGIRTRGELAPTCALQAHALDHYATSPYKNAGTAYFTLSLFLPPHHRKQI
ncbi:MAG: hypothetical protein UX46_C0001G0142, partial [Candidatus Amesbacteria bacterium GW2011_GWC1_46_24]